MSEWKLVCRGCIGRREVCCIGILQEGPYPCDSCGSPLPLRDDGRVTGYFPVQDDELRQIISERKSENIE